MKIIPFQPEDFDDVVLIHHENYKDLNLERFFWQPCQQIESLEKNCFKIVCKNESVKGYAAVYALDEAHYRLNILVAPENKRHGIGTTLFREI